MRWERGANKEGGTADGRAETDRVVRSGGTSTEAEGQGAERKEGDAAREEDTWKKNPVVRRSLRRETTDVRRLRCFCGVGDAVEVPELKRDTGRYGFWPKCHPSSVILRYFQYNRAIDISVGYNT